MTTTIYRAASSARTEQQNVYMPPRATTPDPALAAVLRRLRQERNLSQQTLASAAGITTGSYAKHELGRINPTWTSVRAIAEALGVTLKQLAEAVEAEDSDE
jgi:transcriptional regulator with XRE-family HTH domain